MNFYSLTKEQALIEKYIDLLYDKSNHKAEPIYDGIVDEEIYLKSIYKVIWVLKEPYDEGNKQGGGWSLVKDLLNQDEIYENVVKGSPTWQTMIYTTYGIMNDFISYKEMDYIRDDPHMAQVLKSIGIININKMPGNSRSNDKDIAEKYEFWKPLLNWQLKVYNPDIIIFGNTFQYFKNDLFPNGITMNHINGLDYCIDNDKLYLYAYHPAQTIIERNIYVQSILEIVKNWSNTRK